jgi:hypothetical protein
MLDRDEMGRWQRLTAAMLAQAASDDPEAFAQVVVLLDRARELLPDVADHLRATATDTTHGNARGYSWADLAAALGVTRSAVAQRFDPDRRVLPDTEPGQSPARQFRDYLTS